MITLKTENITQFVSEEEWAAALSEAEAVYRKLPEEDERFADSLGWADLSKWAGEDTLLRIREIAGKVRENSDVFVLIGVGGSNNAARSVIEALTDNDGTEIVYAGNTLSPHALKKMLKKLEGKNFTIDCIAKNFETLEPGSSFRILRQVMAERYTAEEAAERTICTGTAGSSLEELCRKEGYTFVPFPDDIGGRYSAFSYVGLLPMAVSGADIESLVKGAEAMRERLLSEDGQENPAVLYAAARNLLFRKGYGVEMLSSFEPRLKWFYKWWIQLFAESEGKDGKGLFPAAAEYSEELHAVGQFLQDGTPFIFETFLDVKDPGASLIVQPDGKADGFDYLNGWDFADINRAAFRATLKAHSEKMPCLVLEAGCIDEYHFGELFYFFQFACRLSGRMLGIDPFDQPGVEAYKKWMFEALGK